MQIRVLGPLEVSLAGEPVRLGGHRQRLVLAALLARAGEAVSTDRLIDDVWGDDPPASARKSLQAYVSRLRQLLGDGYIEAVPGGYRLDLDGAQYDADRLTRLVDEARSLTDEDPDRAAALLRDALAMWRGPAFGDLADEPCLTPIVESLHEQRRAALTERIEADLRRGKHNTVIGELQSLTTRHPLVERLWGQLMLALYRSGRQADALRAYQRARRILAEELGIEPSPELQSLEQQILDHSDIIGATQMELPPSVERRTNPYRGLAAFQEEDAALFHGRESMIADIVTRLDTSPFVAVIGPSGSGKSSLVRAGVIPALRKVSGDSAPRCIATMSPGSHPFAALEAALERACDPASLAEQFRGDDLDLLRAALRVAPREGARVVLVIDQFEELFTLVRDEGERTRFFRNLAEALEDPNSPLKVVITLRADFYHRPLEYPGIATWIGSNQLPVEPLGSEELGRAARLPAAAAGVSLELELVSELVAHGGHPGTLPLFQYTLTELYDRLDGTTMTLDAYRAFGGINGALVGRSEEVLHSLDEPDQALARQVFLRMVSLDESGAVTRRRVDRREFDALADLQGIERVLSRFGSARLLSFDRNPLSDEPTVDLVHEAILTEWPRLSGWIDQSREDLQIHRSVIEEARAWQGSGLHPDYLLTGARLAVVEHWTAASDIELSTQEVSFIQASVERRSKEEAEERTRRTREAELERRSARRLRVLVGVLTAATIGAAALTAVAVNRSREADRLAATELEQRLLAEQRRTDAEIAATRLRAADLVTLANLNLDRDPQLSLLLSLHAVEIYRVIGDPIPQGAVAAVHWALQSSGVTFTSMGYEAVAVPGPDGMRGIYDLPIQVLLDFAHSNVARGLTEGECATYFPETACPELSAPAGAIAVAEEVEPADPARPLAGTRLTIWGALSGPQAEGLSAEIARFASMTGVEATYLGLDDLEARLASVAASARPDAVFIPQPGFIATAGRTGQLVDIGQYVDRMALAEAHSQYLIDLATVGDDGAWPTREGGLYGVPANVNIKSIIWYPEPEFTAAGYEIPDTWDELVELSDQIVADGTTPWCWGEESGGASGWPATDFLEDLVLHEWGVDVYDAWVAGELPFASPEIRSSFERMGEILFRPGYLAGGLGRAITQSFATAPDPMFSDPPGCFLHKQASFISLYFPFGVELGSDVTSMPFPAVVGGLATEALGAGEYVIALRDRPEVREFIRYVASPEFGSDWARIIPGFVSAHSRFDQDNYLLCDAGNCTPDLQTRLYAEQVVAALRDDTFRFDGSDLMCEGGWWMWQGMLDYMKQGPDSLDRILEQLDAAREDCEGRN